MPELPFRPEDIEKLLSPVDDSPLNGDFLDIIVQYFAACNTHITAISGNAWVAEPVENTLPCDETSIFILLANINSHSIPMVIHVARRNAITVGQQCKEDQQKLQQLASCFVNDRMQEPFNSWNEGWTMQHDTNPQHFDARNSDLHYLWVVMNITVGKAPPSFDHQLLRSYLYAICVTINHLASAAAALGSGSPGAKSAASRNGDTLKTLWDLISSTDMIQNYQDHALSEFFERIENGVDPAGFANNDFRNMFLREMADSYKATRASELERVQAHANHLVILTDVFRYSSRMSLED
ncbi:hypothetical protein F5883DRAFT_655518 [Diaporthe sp. PMI_573]|nr:hypothetical protein F5883DRAFT_655518 [Diaporthaceae sp. PMI_573]